MPDWSKLHTYTEQPWKSFEELCYQIAYRLFSSKGELTRIDDTGGGDGVEFYLTQPNRQETGWQAKFYYPQPRLTTNRKGHISDSLARSLKNHPNLEKWILCTPTAFTPDEQQWFDRTLQKSAGRVRLEHWDSSKIDAMLTRLEMAGIKLNFFGELEFTPEWFRRQVEGQLRNVKDKYDPLLHTGGPADLAAHTLLGDRLFLEELVRLQENFRQYRGEFIEKAAEAQDVRFDVQLQGLCRSALQHLREISRLVEEGAAYLSSAVKLVQAGRVETIDRAPILKLIEDTRSAIGEFYRAAEVLANANHKLTAPPGSDEKKAKELFEYTYRRLSRPVNSYSEELLSLLYSLSGLLDAYSSHALHFLGSPGVGKTHLTCNLSSQRIQLGLPAVLLLGRSFSPGTTLKKKILEICDIPASYSFEDFLSALASYAFSRRTKAVIAIDGLNESKAPSVWAEGLGELESAVEGRSRIALITTCRTSYVDAIWDTKWPKNSLSLTGFAPDKLEEAVQKYFDHYKIQATLTSASLAFFRNPLYLKIFCEGQNPDRSQHVTVHIGEQSFLAVFDAFLGVVNRRISEKLSKPRSADVARNRLLTFARELWNTNSRSMLMERAFLLLDKLPSEEVNWDSSLMRNLEDEGLLITRDWEPQSKRQLVSFTYDLLGGYLIAKASFEGTDQESARTLVQSKEFESRLLADDFRGLHPMWEDILRCAAVFLPERFQLYLQSEVRGTRALNFGIRALFEMRPSSVREIDKRSLEVVFNTLNNRNTLLELAGATALALDHPLNWEFWSELLKRLPTSERDESWTEVVRRNADSFLSLISNIERECRNSASFSNEAERRLKLAAEYLSWLLVSTHRRVRDFATKALYSYGRRFPRELFALTLASFEVDDPYMRERLIAASYGVAMALYKPESSKTFGGQVFPAYARALYKAIFTRNAKNGTTHVLIRDFAKHTLDLAVLLNPKLLGEKERKSIVPPYRHGGIRRLHKSKDRNREQYRDGNAPLGMDFHNYTLGRLVPRRSNYDFNDPQFKKVESHVLWRIYDLGYSLERFGEIDKQIASLRFYAGRSGSNEGRVDRYGKKYAWIAFFELYGLLQDRRIISIDWDGSDEARPSDVDIEPSFPEKPVPLSPLEISFLEPKRMATREWVQKGPAPDVKPHLALGTISGQQGSWVLLDGNFVEEDEGCGHRIVLNVLALLVRKGDARRLVDARRKSIENGYWLPRHASSYYSFAGEMPWCESIPINSWTDLELLMEVQKRTESKEEAANRFKRERGIRIKFSEIGLPLWAGKHSTSQLARDRKKPQLIEERITEKFEVLLPTRSMSWESYHTETSKGQGTMLAKDLAGPLGLWVDLPSTDFRDEEGGRATFTYDWGDSPYKNDGRFIYIRQDLLARFLETSGLECVWGLWGERDYPLNAYQAHERGKGERPCRATFQACWAYPLE